MADSVDDDGNALFSAHRSLLFSMVYNMLASIADTEDVLQDTWLAWMLRNRSGGSEIEHPRAYLVRIAINNALVRREAVGRRRETYVGPWLPEPLPDGGHDRGDGAEVVVHRETVSMAILVVLETLTPLERAVFVLHDVFGYPHGEIADMLDRNAPAIRQLAHRAREHVQSGRPRQQTDPQTQQRVTEKFLVTAQRGHDMAGLLAMLAPEVTMWSDGGGKRRAARRPIHGQDPVARVVSSPTVLGAIPDLHIGYRSVNGSASAVLYSGGVAHAVIALDIDPVSELVIGIYVVVNPDKLVRIGSLE